MEQRIDWLPPHDDPEYQKRARYYGQLPWERSEVMRLYRKRHPDVARAEPWHRRAGEPAGPLPGQRAVDDPSAIPYPPARFPERPGR